MEIKQGDKVRVSKDAPKMYLRRQDYFFIEDDCKVDMVEDDNAVITNGPRIIAIPCKYLVKVDAEAKEAKPTEPKFHIGQRVRHILTRRVDVIEGISQSAPYIYHFKHMVDPINGQGIFESDLEPYTEPTEQTEAEKPNHTIKIPVEVDLSDSYWDAYAADLAKEVAKEVALKIANKFNDPEQAAEYAVKVAKAVVEGLKRK